MLDYSQMTRGDFISSLHALILDNPAATLDDLENVIIIALLDRDTQRLVTIGQFELLSLPDVVAAEIGVEVVRGNFSVVLTVIADEDHQTAGELTSHRIAEAMRARDSEGAREAMRSHLIQTTALFESYARARPNLFST